ncbi:MAG: hypothetical protein M5U01_23985 [Ardenticatenaceae bacterium]|nr:hypothetical protein [Ardenticatenaceae bacterium]
MTHNRLAGRAEGEQRGRPSKSAALDRLFKPWDEPIRRCLPKPTPDGPGSAMPGRWPRTVPLVRAIRSMPATVDCDDATPGETFRGSRHRGGHTPHCERLGGSNDRSMGLLLAATLDCGRCALRVAPHQGERAS